MQIDMPLEFRKACRNLGQDLGSKARALNIADAIALLVQTAIIGVDRNEAEVIRNFVEHFLSKGLTSEQMAEFWRSTPAEIYFYDGEQVERFLKSLSAKLTEPPYQEVRP